MPNDTIPFRTQPMLATLVRDPFDRKGWTYEEKYDGIRILAYKEGSKVQLFSRNALDRTASFSAVAAAIQKLPQHTLLLDGEMVRFDKKRISRFQLLQQGGDAAVYAVFDCLYKEGKDLRHAPLSERRAALEASIVPGALLRPSHRLAANGVQAYAAAKRSGYEGLVAKDLASPYVEGRSALWLKVKVHQEDEFIVAGFSAPSGSRKYFGALLLAAYQGEVLRYVGKVGTGFNEKTLAALHGRFQPLIRKRSGLANPPRQRDLVFLAPKLVAQISYQEWTADLKLRQPVFLGLRDDKPAREVFLPEASA